MWKDKNTEIDTFVTGMLYLFKEEAISALEKFPTPASRLALTDILEQEQCFYKVRMQACFCLAKVRDKQRLVH